MSFLTAKILITTITITAFSLSHVSQINDEVDTNALRPLHALEYATLEALGVTCSPLDTCSVARTEDSLSGNNCECGEHCTRFRTCCIDSPYVTEEKEPSNWEESCVQLPNSDSSIFMVASCKRGWSGDPAIRVLCEDNDHNMSDPFLVLPVTKISSRVTYRNYFCSVCHEEEQGDVILWDIAVYGYFRSMKYFSDEWKRNFIDDLVYRADIDSWGFWEIGGNGESVFTSVQVEFSLSEPYSSLARPCRCNLVSSCAPTWSDDVTKEMCEAYMAVIYAIVRNGKQSERMVAFRNAHCAQCNFVTDFRYYLCADMRPQKGSPSFAVLLDINRSDGDEVGVSSSCGRNEVYDPFFKKCRAMACALPGYVIKGKKCVPS